MNSATLIFIVCIFTLEGVLTSSGSCEGGECNLFSGDASRILKAILKGKQHRAMELFHSYCEQDRPHIAIVNQLLYEAMKKGQSQLVAEIVKYLAANGVDIHKELFDGHTLLQNALLFKSAHTLFGNGKLLDNPKPNFTHIVESLLQYPHEKDTVDVSTGRTPVAQATTYRDVSCMKLLLDHGHSIESTDGAGRTPLLIACDTLEISIHVAKLITGHGNLYYDSSSDGGVETDERMDSFAELGLDVHHVAINDRTSFNKTLFDDALFRWNEEILALLLRYGADITKQDVLGNSALHLAAYCGNYMAIRQLMKHALEKNGQPLALDVPNKDGLVPLQLAAIGNHIQAQKALIELGADPTVLTSLKFYGQEQQESQSEEVSSTLELRVHQPTPTNLRKSRENITFSHGGWNSVTYPDIDIDYCDIDVVHNPSLEEFYENYFKVRKPVVVRGIAEDWGAFTTWNKENLLSKYGHVSFKTFSRKDRGPPISGEMSLRQYLQYMDENSGIDTKPVWLVDTSLDTGAQDLTKDAHFIPLLHDIFTSLPFGFSNYQFMIAPAYAGASVHYHNTAGNVLIFGRKRWFFFPPSQAFYTVKHIHEWYVEDYPNIPKEAKPLECIQLPGDFVYVPDMWAHGVIYSKDSIGIAFLFTG